MDGNGKNNNENFYHYLLLICTLISIILFMVYLSGVLYYIIKNIKNRKLCVFWIDYISLIFGAIYFTFVYLIYLFGYSEEKRNPKPKELPRLFPSGNSNVFEFDVFHFNCVFIFRCCYGNKTFDKNEKNEINKRARFIFFIRKIEQYRLCRYIKNEITSYLYYCFQSY